MATASQIQRGLAAIAFLVPGIAVAVVDYTGFWKENCTDPYGLQIKHYENRYTVTFCGPGGCGTPDSNLATAIEGDKGYVVLSPETIKIIYSEGYTPIYTKCTSETNPVLQYSAADLAEERRNVVIAAVFHVAYLLAAVAAYIFMY